MSIFTRTRLAPLVPRLVPKLVPKLVPTLVLVTLLLVASLWPPPLSILSTACAQQPPAATQPAENTPLTMYPKRKSGLWEVRSTGSHAHGLGSTRHCVGERSDSVNQHLDRNVGAKGSCTMGAFVRAGNAWAAESVCREGKASVISKAIASGDFETEYRIDTTVTYDPPLGGIRKEDKDALLATFIGPCLGNQKAGDMIISGVGVFNTIDGTFRAEPSRETQPRRRRGT